MNKIERRKRRLDKMVDLFIREGLAFTPTVIKGIGLQTRVLFKSEKQHILEESPEKFIRKLCEAFGCDRKSSQKKYGNDIGKKQFVPLPLTYWMILIPFKGMNTTLESYRKSWVRLEAIERILDCGPDHVQLNLINGEKVEMLCSLQFARDQYHNAEMVRYKYKDQHQIGLVELIKENLSSYPLMEGSSKFGNI